MNKIQTLLIVVSCLFVGSVSANNLKIDSVAYDAATGELSFDISWENAWNVAPGYRDAVWIFAKYKNANSIQWRPVKFAIQAIGERIEDLLVDQPTTSDGRIIELAETNSGQKNVESTRISIAIEGNQQLSFVNPSFKVFGVEMVHIPSGSFFAGDGTDNSFINGDDLDLLTPAFIETVQQPQAFQINTGIDDMQITFPPSYPKGVVDFYMMKYEVTQQQIVDFLNTLTLPQQQGLVGSATGKYILSNRNIPEFRNAIAMDLSATSSSGNSVYGLDLNNNNVFNEFEDGQNIACNFVRSDMALAYLDWAHLRPMTPFEYEKACRGFDDPIAGEYAWGVTTFTKVTGIVNTALSAETSLNIGIGLANLETDLGPMRVGFAANGSTNRLQSGGSFFGVMNLGDNLLEMVGFSLHALSPTLESYNTSTRGDGELSPEGRTDEQVFNDLNLAYKGGSFSVNILPMTTSGIALIPGLTFPDNGLIQAGFRGVR